MMLWSICFHQNSCWSLIPDGRKASRPSVSLFSTAWPAMIWACLLCHTLPTMMDRTHWSHEWSKSFSQLNCFCQVFSQSRAMNKISNINWGKNDSSEELATKKQNKTKQTSWNYKPEILIFVTEIIMLHIASDNFYFCISKCYNIIPK